MRTLCLRTSYVQFLADEKVIRLFHRSKVHFTMRGLSGRVYIQILSKLERQNLGRILTRERRCDPSVKHLRSIDKRPTALINCAHHRPR